MSVYTAKLSLRRNEQEIHACGKAYPVEGEVECYTHDKENIESKTPQSFPVKFDSAPQLADWTANSFGGYAVLTTAAQREQSRCLCWTAGTGIELRYKSLSFWEGDGENSPDLW